MQKDMKIGILAGLVLAAVAMLYVCTRSDFSIKARILNRENISKRQSKEQQDEKQAQIERVVTFGPAVAKAKRVEPGNKIITETDQTRFIQEIPPIPVVEKQPEEVIEEPPVRRYKAKRFYIVRQGDTLSKISKKYYSTANKWYVIYDANRDIISNPNKIKVGMKLHIPN